MTIRYYQGWQLGGSGDWYDPTSWSSGTVPAAGDTVIISTPGPDIGPTPYGSNRDGVDHITVDVQPAFSFSQPVLAGDGITYGAGFTLNFTDTPGSKITAPAVSMAANGTTMFRGTMNLDARGGSFTIDVSGPLGSGTFVNAGSGRINVEHGTRLVFSDSTLSGLTNNGVIAVSDHSTAEVGPTNGHGSFTLRSGSTLVLDGAVSANQKIQFLSGDDTLVLNAASVFPTGSSLASSGDISGFRGGDVIQLDAPSDTPASVTYLARYHVLAVRDASGDLVAKMRLNGNYQANAFVLTADGKGDFDISLRPTGPSAGGATNAAVLNAAADLNPATDFPVAGLAFSTGKTGAAASLEEGAGAAMPFGSIAYPDHTASGPLAITNHGQAMG